ncbi:hypothetical protein J2S21_004468 [Peribacillus cavernae]|nr:hypothetical protein [Peribacillus cavernae]
MSSPFLKSKFRRQNRNLGEKTKNQTTKFKLRRQNRNSVASYIEK